MPRCRNAAAFVYNLIHGSPRLMEQRLLLPLLFNPFYQVVTTQTSHLLTSRSLASKVKTAHHVLDCKLLRQSRKTVIGLLPALHVH